ncbi:MAG TPA: STAS domain-containing protein [Mycobacteriales bacterium]|nr:STAS domain-containing protein [Mycobacteriales bacterium]
MPLDPELDFELSVLDDADRTVISIAGELDVATTPALQAAIAAAVERALPIVLDASAVSFMDSTGLAGMLAMRNDGASDLRLVLQRPSPAVRRILELTGIDGIFEIEPAEDH